MHTYLIRFSPESAQPHEGCAMSRVPRSRLHRPVDSACILTLCRPNFGRCYGHADSSGNWIDDHRRVLAESILIRHAQFFCIELVNHAISASDIRQILRPRPDIAESLTPSEVAKRWLQLCPSLRVTSVAPAPPTQAEILNITRSKARIREIRLQLSDVSWWMRLFCQRLAQHLNTHDGLDGPFHHGRFRSQKLLDDDATNTTLSQVNLAALPLGTPEQRTPTALRELAVQLAAHTHSGMMASAVAPRTITTDPPACDESADVRPTPTPLRSGQQNKPSAKRPSRRTGCWKTYFTPQRSSSPLCHCKKWVVEVGGISVTTWNSIDCVPRTSLPTTYPIPRRLNHTRPPPILCD